MEVFISVIVGLLIVGYLVYENFVKEEAVSTEFTQRYHHLVAEKLREGFRDKFPNHYADLTPERSVTVVEHHQRLQSEINEQAIKHEKKPELYKPVEFVGDNLADHYSLSLAPLVSKEFYQDISSGAPKIREDFWETLQHAYSRVEDAIAPENKDVLAGMAS